MNNGKFGNKNLDQIHMCLEPGMTLWYSDLVGNEAMGEWVIGMMVRNCTWTAIRIHSLISP